MEKKIMQYVFFRTIQRPIILSPCGSVARCALSWKREPNTTQPSLYTALLSFGDVYIIIQRILVASILCFYFEFLLLIIDALNQWLEPAKDNEQLLFVDERATRGDECRRTRSIVACRWSVSAHRPPAFSTIRSGNSYIEMLSFFFIHLFKGKEKNLSNWLDVICQSKKKKKDLTWHRLLEHSWETCVSLF